MNENEIHYLFTLAGGLVYSGGTRYSMTDSQLKRFVYLLLESERQACAETAFKICLTDAAPGAIADAIRERNK